MKSWLDVAVIRCPYCGHFYMEASWYVVEMESDIECGKCRKEFNSRKNVTDRALLEFEIDERGEIQEVKVSEHLKVGNNPMNLKGEIEEFLSSLGAFKVGVADPKHGFEMAKEGCHPKDIMENCNSVIAFALHVGLDYYTTLNYCQRGNVESRILVIYRNWVSQELADFLRGKGYEAIVPRGYRDEKQRIARLSYKLAAYEAGLGVFGRPSILITPQYGPRVEIGVVLTDARIKPDTPLKDFNPCEKCKLCVNLCPAKAIDEKLPPPKGFNRDRCIQFIQKIREKTSRNVMFCGYCFNLCPIGEKAEKTFSLGSWKTLQELDEKERERLLQNLKQDKSI
ncbi:MAG: hypothetical protein QW667_00745 [Candidatus Bathyarchaeia archaeon]